MTDPNNKRGDQEMNRQQQGVDKAPGEEAAKGEPVTREDLKGKKVDADPSRDSDRPLSR